MTPTKIEILTTLDAIRASEWDSLAHAPAAANKTQSIKDLSSESESLSQPHLSPELDSISQLRNTPTPAQRAGNGSEIQPDSTHEVPDSFSQEDDTNPFISHAFLSALENSRSTGERSGWSPLFLLAKTGNDEICGALPVYAKAHSRGEYVFDHAFAEAYHRHGEAYYPKLQISVPFTPAQARKLLVSPEAEEAATRSALLAGLEALRERLDVSSIHATFLTRADQESFS
ncbi:MAG: GNAT family N-acetyltransferase, partial [Proteobacteria bacterium]|nr:GNAT family N-acetyltransferase [Pseudomonadota bacterium]